MRNALKDIPSHELASALYDRLCYERSRLGDSGEEILENAHKTALGYINKEHAEAMLGMLEAV